MFGVPAGTGIFDEHQGKAEAGTLAGGGLDAGLEIFLPSQEAIEGKQLPF